MQPEPHPAPRQAEPCLRCDIHESTEWTCYCDQDCGHSLCAARKRDGMTPAEFLRARLDDRQARAAKLLRYAQENDVAVRDPRLLGRIIPGWHEWPEVEQMAREALAEVEAKRRIVDEYERVLAEAEIQEVDSQLNGEAGGLWFAVLCLCLPYAEHPDYDESWRLDEDERRGV